MQRILGQALRTCNPQNLEVTIHPSNRPVVLDIPGIVNDGLPGDPIRRAWVYTVPNSTPNDHQKRHSIVSQQAPCPTFEVQPSPGFAYGKGTPQQAQCQDQAPKAIHQPPLKVISSTTAQSRHCHMYPSAAVQYYGCMAITSVGVCLRAEPMPEVVFTSELRGASHKVKGRSADACLQKGQY